MTTSTPQAAGDDVLGHPRGLMTLFFTELWERFGYYGMRALLILYMTDTVGGGLGMNTEMSGAVYGLFTFGVYALALPGGWIADRVIGQRQAVFVGGVIIAAGYYSLGLPMVLPGSELWSFYLGLTLVVLGTGLLKPNVSAIVGGLYTDDAPARRDAGFSIFYMGINLGAFLAPLACGYLGMMEKLKPTAPIEGSAYRYAHSLPINLDDAMNKLNYSRSLKQVMGSRFVEAFMAVKEEEQVQYRKVISSWEREFLLLNV